MKTTRCDVCERTEPDVFCRYSRRKRWLWRRYEYDSQGGCNEALDLCESCWEGFRVFMAQKILKGR